MFIRKFLILAVITLSTCAAGNALALSSASIAVTVAPESPAPGESTTITLSSYVYNLDIVGISWYVNGSNAGAGIGKKSFMVTAPDAGKETAVMARVKLPEGDVDLRVTIRTNTMTLLWEAMDSYVPPFYKGKALPLADSNVKVVAMPEIKSGASLINPKNLTYSWQKNYENEEGASGYGKYFYILTQDYLEDGSNVGVTASNLDLSKNSQADISVNSYQPQIIFYKKDKDYGTLWERALFSGEFVKNEDVLVATPYFIAPKDIRRRDLAFTWSINGSSVGVEGILRQNMLPLRVQEGTSGTAKISLKIDNLYKLFQSTTNEIDVQF